MARHKRQDQAEVTMDKDEATVVNGPPVLGDTEQKFVGPTQADAMGKQEHVPTADEAARAYSQSEIDRSNAVAREQDERDGNDGENKKETKAERFVRLAQKRVTKALLVLSHVHNLTNSNSYSYTPEQAQKIVNALVMAVEKIADGFSGTKNGKVTFTL